MNVPLVQVASPVIDIVLPVCNVVAVLLFPVTAPVTLPITLPVTLPVKFPVTSPVKFPVNVPLIRTFPAASSSNSYVSGLSTWTLNGHPPVFNIPSLILFAFNSLIAAVKFWEVVVKVLVLPIYSPIAFVAILHCANL